MPALCSSARCALLAALLCATTALAADPLRTVAAIRALAHDEAARGLPVKVEGVVTYFNAPQIEMMLHDGHDGVYVLLPKQLEGLPQFTAGDQVLVEGFTQPGEFVPLISLSRLSVLGKGKMPEPHRIIEGELFSPDLDCQWVETPAVVVGAENRKNGVFTLTVEASGHPVPVKIPWTSDAISRAAELMQRPVMVRGSAGAIFNKQRQLTGRFLFVESFDDVVPFEAGPTASDAPLRTVTELLRYGETLQSRVRVRGVVTETVSGGIYLRGDDASLSVHWAGSGDFAPGARVEAEGFAAVAPFRPILRATRLTLLGNGDPPKPVPLALKNDEIARQEAELVTVDAEFLARREVEPGQVILECRAHNWIVEALPERARSTKSIDPGAILRLTGVCELITTRSLPPESVDGLRLHLRRSDGIVVLQRAPLWTLERISWALGFLAVFALAAVTWIALLRRRVANQTRIIAEQIERAAVNEERQRIARELHDTLEQDLAGTSAQLRNARRRLDAEPARAGDAIDLAERMLDHCREEARTSIRDLRSVTLEQRGLRGALEEFLAPLAAESSVRFRIEVEGQPYSLPGPTGIHLLRIAHQAVVNAIQHGHSREIVVRLAYEEELVRLEIRDDGTGFDPGESARRGRFGILGMRERANKLQAELEIESAPGAGSCIRIVVPLREAATVNVCQP